MSLFAMIPLGAAEVIGGLAQGTIADKFGNKAGLVFILVLTGIGYAILFLCIGFFTFSPLTFAMTFAWGL